MERRYEKIADPFVRMHEAAAGAMSRAYIGITVSGYNLPKPDCELRLKPSNPIALKMRMGTSSGELEERRRELAEYLSDRKIDAAVNASVPSGAIDSSEQQVSEAALNAIIRRARGRIGVYHSMREGDFSRTVPGGKALYDAMMDQVSTRRNSLVVRGATHFASDELNSAKTGKPVIDSARDSANQGLKGAPLPSKMLSVFFPNPDDLSVHRIDQAIAIRDLSDSEYSGPAIVVVKHDSGVWRVFGDAIVSAGQTTAESPVKREAYRPHEVSIVYGDNLGERAATQRRDRVWFLTHTA